LRIKFLSLLAVLPSFYGLKNYKQISFVEKITERRDFTNIK
jgi:hypothetical protein